ncbi:sulfotransferase [uncultured Lutibacter sp.]|uniref:sulfotransferase family protein n=1 Tax=uncultured Lutibacter sp. TaxID=437739 RepID=UPI00261D9B5F|nr:sulfotransferase [uncultured Lutibacter sp.]
MNKKPHFIIAGERRSGTTTLYDVLSKHPEIGMFEKTDFDYFIEPELFSLKPIIDENSISNWEQSHSKLEYNRLSERIKESITGQKDADLLWWKQTHSRLARYLPYCKFIIILRDPVKRAESQYFNELKKGRETLSFKKAIEREFNGNLTSWEKLHLQYIKRGCYIESIEHFIKYIPKERVKIVILEELMENWSEEMESICTFLGINNSEEIFHNPIQSNKEELLEKKSYAKYPLIKYLFNFWDRLSEAIIVRVANNKFKRDKIRKQLRGFYYTSKRKKQVLNIEIEKYLKNYYKPFNQKLEEFLGDKITKW